MIKSKSMDQNLIIINEINNSIDMLCYNNV